MPETPRFGAPGKGPGTASLSASPARRRIWLGAGLTALLGAVVVGAILTAPSSSTRSSLAANPNLDPGTALDRAAPNFTLTDQFGHQVSLRSFRGKVVILDFNDSQCTTICPLTTTAMLDAQRALGAAGSQVQLLGVDANPNATTTGDVLRYSQVHGMVRAWHFLTGPLPNLRSVWKAYGIGVEVRRGQIDHTPALFLIDPQGRERRVYLTQQSYAAIPQLGQLLAQDTSRLLPGHPPVSAGYSYAEIKGIAPDHAYSLLRLGGGSVALGPGSAHLYLFFATWDREVTALSRELGVLDAYQAAAASRHLPPITAVDEGSVEPSASALPTFLRQLPRPLSYPVAVDGTGRVADGYGVQDEPWFVLVTASGGIAWYHDVATSGWPSVAELQREVPAALSRAPSAPSSLASAERALAGSPAALAAVHRQADQVLAGSQALNARVRALRGYPIVVNVWASWCGPCQGEFGLLASAAARYGRQVAFLGADVNDSSGDAEAFLRQHSVTYPSYAMPETGVQSLLPQGVLGLPTTFFINRAGRVVFVHTGQYASQGTLDQDIQTHALGG